MSGPGRGALAAASHTCRPNRYRFDPDNPLSGIQPGQPPPPIAAPWARRARFAVPPVGGGAWDALARRCGLPTNCLRLFSVQSGITPPPAMSCFRLLPWESALDYACPSQFLVFAADLDRGVSVPAALFRPGSGPGWKAAGYDSSTMDCGELDKESGLRPLRASHTAGDDLDILCKVTVGLSDKIKGSPKAHTIKLTVSQGGKTSFEQVRDARVLNLESRRSVRHSRREAP